MLKLAILAKPNPARDNAGLCLGLHLSDWGQDGAGKSESHGAGVQKLRQIIEEHDTREGRLFDLFIQSLIVLSICSFSVETLPDLSPEFRRILQGIEVITVAIFTIEYLLRIALAENRLRFIFSFFGIIDLCAILPFYIASGIDLRSLRAFRLLRLFRVLKVVRYNKAIRRLHKALSLVREELMMFFGISLLLLYLSAVGIYYFENEAQPEAFASIFHCLWWALTTLTTVGYGDVYPVTLGGRIFTFFILMIGLGFVAAPCGMLASALTEARRLESE